MINCGGGLAVDGLVNLLKVKEQSTYRMFIRELDDVDNRKAKECMMKEMQY